MRKIEITQYSLTELENLLNSKEDYKVGIRLMACIQIAKGATSRDIEDFYDMSYSRICHWVKRLNEFGVDGLKNSPKTGRKSHLKQEDFERIKKIILYHSPAEFGFRHSSWNGTILTDFINREFNCQYKKAAVYRMIGNKLGLFFQKGKGFIAESNNMVLEERI